MKRLRAESGLATVPISIATVVAALFSVLGIPRVSGRPVSGVATMSLAHALRTPAVDSTAAHGADARILFAMMA